MKSQFVLIVDHILWQPTRGHFALLEFRAVGKSRGLRGSFFVTLGMVWV